MERDDSHGSCQPLLSSRSEGGSVLQGAGALATEQERVLAEARAMLVAQLATLRNRKEASLAETSELLRDTCQNLSDLATVLQQAWRKAHPQEPAPTWTVETIPEEELAKIGWDFHANRVQMERLGGEGGSVWQALGMLLKGDLSGNFTKPPSAPQVAEAFTRTVTRLGGNPVPCH
jgi:hypothetical protein